MLYGDDTSIASVCCIRMAQHTYRCVDVLYANAYSTNSTDVRTNHADTHVHVQGTVYSTCTWGGGRGGKHVLLDTTVNSHHPCPLQWAPYREEWPFVVLQSETVTGGSEGQR